MTADPANRTRRPTLIQDAVITIVTRFGLAVLIFGTDIVLASSLIVVSTPVPAWKISPATSSSGASIAAATAAARSPA